jgi:hypothetical protein
MPFPDWGNVPSWLGAGSLLLAFRIFLRDRANGERTQVDLVGVWCIPKYKWLNPLGDERIESGHLEWFIRNGSQLPVTVARVAYEARTRWMVRDLAQWGKGAPAVWSEEPGTCTNRGFLDDILVPPGEPWSYDLPINFGHHVPDHTDQITPHAGLTATVRWVLLADNAGRRWEARPGSGKRTRRIRWFSRRRPDYPLAWKRPLTVWLNVKRYEAWELAKRAGTFVVRPVGRLLRR